MQQYKQLVRKILTEGEIRGDRTGVGTKSIFGGRVEFDLRERFPLVTCKETRWKTAFLEMLFFLSGETNIKWLNDRGCKLWDAWADKDGELGPVYGAQYRHWTDSEGHKHDQLKNLVRDIRLNPKSRRMLVSAWNVGELNEMALMPCHYSYQLYISNDGYVDMQVNQRSWDVALGAPFNIAAYALLLTLLARTSNLKPRKLSFCYGDAHIYLNHLEAMEKVIQNGDTLDNARLVINTGNTDIDGYKLEDFSVEGYISHPFVKLEVAV